MNRSIPSAPGTPRRATRLPARRLLLVAVAALALFAATFAGGRTVGEPPPRERARRLYQAALDHELALDQGGRLRSLREAYAADPSYVPALAEAAVAASGYWLDQVADELDSVAVAGGDRRYARCVRRLASTIVHRILLAPPATAPALPATSPGEICESYLFLAQYPRGASAPLFEAHLRELRNAAPESQWVAAQLAARLARNGAWAALDSLTAELSDPRLHPMYRIVSYAWRPLVLHARGRHAEAVALEREGRAFAERAGPGALVHLLRNSVDHRVFLDTRDSVLAAHVRGLPDLIAEAGRVALARGDLQARTQEAHSLGLELLNKGRLEESLLLWDSLLGAWTGSGAGHFVAELHSRRGRTLVKLGRLRDGESALLEARELAARLENLHVAFEVEHNLLHLYEARGDIAAAVDAGSRFHCLAQLAGHDPQYLMANHDLGWLLQRRGAAAQARPFLQAMVALARTMEGMAFWAGEYFEFTGDLDSALLYYGLDTNGYYPDRRYAALARVSEALGEPEAALAYASLSDEFILGATGFPEHAPMLPGVLARSGRRAEAERAYERSLALLARRGQPAAWADVAAQLALLRMERDPAGASRLADSAAVAARRAGAVETRLRAVSVAALARVRGAHSATALAQLDRVTREADRMAIPALAAELHERRGHALAAARRTATALAAFRRAADLRDSLARSLAADPLRAGFRATARQASEGALAAVLAWRGSEATRTQWFAAWSLRRKSVGIVEKAGPGGMARLDVAALRGRLPADAAVIDYVVLDDVVAALVLTRTSARLVTLPVRARDLADDVEALVGSLAPRIGSTIDTARAYLDEGRAARLYGALLAPLEPLLAGRTRLMVVPDGPLHQLPFDALVAGRGAGGAPEYVLDRFTMSFAPSLALLDGRRGPAGGAAVIVAGPAGSAIPGVRDELAAVGAALGPRAPVLLSGATGSEAELRRLAPGAGLLHITAHAYANGANPAYSRLELAATGSDDGSLHAYEIEQLRLPGTLVVLSACETAGGRLAGSEGPLSLSRAFLRAGASGTVATLWPVGASAAPLMGEFYQALATDRDVAHALRQAKLSLRRGPWPAPFHWASFTLTTGF